MKYTDSPIYKEFVPYVKDEPGRISKSWEQWRNWAAEQDKKVENRYNQTWTKQDQNDYQALKNYQGTQVVSDDEKAYVGQGRKAGDILLGIGASDPVAQSINISNQIASDPYMQYRLQSGMQNALVGGALGGDYRSGASAIARARAGAAMEREMYGAISQNYMNYRALQAKILGGLQTTGANTMTQGNIARIGATNSYNAYLANSGQTRSNLANSYGEYRNKYSGNVGNSITNEYNQRRNVFSGQYPKYEAG